MDTDFGKLGGEARSVRDTSAVYKSVSLLAKELNECLETQFGSVKFSGEIAQLTVAASGHLYFTVKDENAQLQAAMWRSNVARLSWRPQQGDKVLCVGTANIYGRSGRFQMLVRSMRPDGEGDLQRRFLKLKATLERQGLFAPERKRELPFFPRAVGIVTSPTGAVLHDIQVTARGLMPSVQLVLAGVRVQGEGAAAEIAAAIELFNRRANVDVIIVGRGGGSLEDLWPFNEEVVARAIFASAIPIVSAVGHETDTTLSDLVADRRAATPTAAAEMVVPDRLELLRMLAEYQRRLNDTSRWFEPLMQGYDDLTRRLQQAMARVVEVRRWRLEALEGKVALMEPSALCARHKESLRQIEQRLKAGAHKQVVAGGTRLAVLQHRLEGVSPARTSLPALSAALQDRETRLLTALRNTFKAARAALEHRNRQLEAHSPRGVLSRGYSIVKSGDKVIANASQVAAGQSLEVVLHQGSLEVSVDSVNEEASAS